MALPPRIAQDIVANGLDDVFVARLDSSGSVQWVRAFGGSGHDRGSRLLAAADGGLVVTGYYERTADLNPGHAEHPMTSNGWRDAFIVSLGPDGDFRWAHSLGGQRDDRADGLGLAPDGSVIVTGAFEDSVDFDPDAAPVGHVSDGSPNVFLLALDGSGNQRWSLSFGGPLEDIGEGVAIGPNGSVFVTGGFNGAVDLDPGSSSDVHTARGRHDVFVAKLQPCFEQSDAGCPWPKRDLVRNR